LSLFKNRLDRGKWGKKKKRIKGTGLKHLQNFPASTILVQGPPETKFIFLYSTAIYCPIAF